MSKHSRIIITLVVAALIICVGSIAFNARPSDSETTHRQLTYWLKDNSIVEAQVFPTPYSGIYAIQGKRRVGGEFETFKITTHLDADEAKALFAKNAVQVEIPGLKHQLIANLIPTLVMGSLIFGLMAYQLRIGRSKKKHKVSHRPDVRFADVAGIDEAKSEISEVVDFLRNPAKYKKLGGKLPKGVLLVGPPGTGKTMLAKAIAGEAKANFFSAHGSDFNEVFVGVGAKRIRELFAQAHKNKPAIIFIDEIDCLAKKRKFDSHTEMTQTNNALLAELDGFESSEGIVVVAATNRPEDLDEALLRPGRIDRKVYVSLPDRKGRRAILAAHTKEKPIHDKEKTLDVLAQTTTEMSGADLANVLNEAAILSAQRNLPDITLEALEESRDKVRWGKERKSMVLKKEERELVAYHEAGHTMINLQKSLLPPLYKVSIIPRGGALGVTTLMPTEDQNIHNKEFMLQELVVLMGGRAAEKVFYGSTTNGAGGDMQMSKDLARKMIHDWGMGEKMYYEPQRGEAEIEINRLLEHADQEAFTMIQQDKANTKKLAEALLKHETLTREQVVNLLYENQPPVDDLEMVDTEAA
ncbi:MAG: ATP-dependent metalloprotease FtsH [Verrucomicrobiales bacterium]|nr:ATP-dependent metalloprotease FtsH [Verrucomicrobiales bacterium]